MARRGRDGGHPMNKLVSARAGFYDNPSDPEGALRHDGGGVTQAAFQDAPVAPSAPLTGASVNTWEFKKATDDDSDAWEETTDEVEPSLALTIEDAQGGAGRFIVTTDPNETTYNTPTNIVVANEGSVWVEVRVRITDHGSTTPIGGISEFQLGFRNTSDSDERLIVHFDKAPITGDMEITVEGSGGDDPALLFPPDSGSAGVNDIQVNLFDGQWHTIILHLREDVSENRDHDMHVYVDGQHQGHANGRTKGSSVAGGFEYEVSDQPMAPMFGAKANSANPIETHVGRILVLQDDIDD